MDIKSGAGYPASALSNFSPHPYILDDVEIHSMEGFLQALKFKEIEMQKHVCTLVGYAAKAKGRFKNWQGRQVLYWQGVEYPRRSPEYQDLLDRAYKAMYEQSEGFRKALHATGKATLMHSIGRIKKNETVLTINEFCGRLMRLRDSEI